jgi:hypothetical protein
MAAFLSISSADLRLRVLFIFFHGLLLLINLSYTFFEFPLKASQVTNQNTPQWLMS